MRIPQGPVAWSISFLSYFLFEVMHKYNVLKMHAENSDVSVNFLTCNSFIVLSRIARTVISYNLRKLP